MPSTVNGIGTCYFLKRNRQFEEAECPHCHNRVKLESYETWYCFCVIFIPILPLGKKQILNYCPSCTRHQVIKFKEWEKIRSEAISETSEEFADAKDNPEAAIKMHGTLLAFQKGEEADRFADIMLNRFGEVPLVQFYLGGCFERQGKGERANACFMKAFDLAPADLTYRRAAALVLMEQQKPDEAKQLLDVFGPETQQFQPPLFFALARAYQGQGRHAEALEVFQMLLKKQPGLGMEKEFAKALRSSEKALGVVKATLPDDPWYRKPVVKWALIAGVIAIALGAWNYYIAQHRTLYVVNGLDTSIRVQVDGLPSILVSGKSQKSVTVPEGKHTAEVTEPAGRHPKIEFELRTAWWERFFRKPVFIADPSKTAALEWEETVYTDVKAAAQDENKFETRVGQSYSSFPHADYHFEDFPQQIKAKQGSRITKSRVGIIPQPPTVVIGSGLALGRDLGPLDDYAESHLEATPDDSDLLNAYISVGAMQGTIERREKFLERHLTDRPVRVMWHRRYQDLGSFFDSGANSKEVYSKLIAKYDEWLKQSPRDASLLYLRGRLEPRARKSTVLLDQALEIDPHHPYATTAKAFSHAVLGQADLALEWYRKAATLKPNEQEFVEGLLQAQLAAKDFQTLEKSVRSELQKNADLLKSQLSLYNILLQTGRAAEAEKEYQAYSERMRQKGIPQFEPILVRQLDLPYLYAKGDFEALATKAKQAGPDAAKFEFIASLERGQLAPIPESSLPFEKPYWHLCRAIVAAQLGDAAQQATAKSAAIELMDKKGDEEGIAAQLLKQGDQAKWDDIQDLLMRPRYKAVLLVVLAEQAPQIKVQCLDLAEKLNYELEFPHHLLRARIAKLRQ